MQLASSTRAQDGFMAAMSLWGKKPHQGFSSENVSLHPGATACNSTTALGVSWRLWSGTVPGATVTYDYDAFANKINSTGTTPNNYLYRGEFFDSDLGLYYLRARYYNPLTGRFMSRDPNDGNAYDPRTLHKYLYVGGDPVNAIDPTGRAELAGFPILLQKVTAWTLVAATVSEAASLVFECVAGVVESVVRANEDGPSFTGPEPYLCYYPPHVPGEEPPDPKPVPHGYEPPPNI